MMSLQKKDIIFCDGEVFSLDRGLLMGAISTTQHKFVLITDIIKMKRAKHEKWICPY
jgi:hypothetical protein